MISNGLVAESRGSSSPADSVLRVIRQALSPEERARKLSWNHCLGELGISSLRLLTLIMDLEEVFGLSVDALARLNTRSTVAAVVQICLGSEPGSEGAWLFDPLLDS